MKFDISFEPETYSRFIDRAKDQAELIQGLDEIGEPVADARVQAGAMAEGDWKRWRKGLNKERRGEFAGTDWMDLFGSILMPGRLLLSARIAQEFAVPLYAAYRRLEDLGKFEKASLM